MQALAIRDDAKRPQLPKPVTRSSAPLILRRLAIRSRVTRESRRVATRSNAVQTRSNAVQTLHRLATRNHARQLHPLRSRPFAIHDGRKQCSIRIGPHLPEPSEHLHRNRIALPIHHRRGHSLQARVHREARREAAAPLLIDREAMHGKAEVRSAAGASL